MEFLLLGMQVWARERKVLMERAEILLWRFLIEYIFICITQPMK